MDDMTLEDYRALEAEVCRNPPEVAGKPGGFFTERRDRMVMLDKLSAAYLKAAAETTHKTPAQLIGEWVRQSIGKSAAL